MCIRDSHEIAGELKKLMEPTGRGGKFVCTLVGLSLRPPMTVEEDQAQYLHAVSYTHLDVYKRQPLEGLVVFERIRISLFYKTWSRSHRHGA